jgi:hypothetical protein
MAEDRGEWQELEAKILYFPRAGDTSKYQWDSHAVPNKFIGQFVCINNTVYLSVNS